jgi:hypothetical protein
MDMGQRLQTPEPPSAIRDRVRAQLAALPATVRAGEILPLYPVDVAPELRALAAQLDQEPH